MAPDFEIRGTLMNVRDYGAVGDGVTDDTAAIQETIDAVGAAGGGYVFFPPGTYLCNGLTVEDDNVTLCGTGRASILKQLIGASDNTFLVSCQGTTPDTTGNRIGLRVLDLQLLGNSGEDPATQYVHLIAISGVTDCVISRCFLNAWRGDAIYLGSGLGTQLERHNERVWITDNTFDGVTKANRNGVTVIDGTGVWIRDNHFRSCSAADRPGAIDIEPNNNVYHRLRNIHVVGNEFDDVGGNVGNIIYDLTPSQDALTTPSHGVFIERNAIRNTTNSQSGVFIRHRQATVTSSTPPNGVVVRNNHILSGAKSPIYVEGVRDIRVEDNIIAGSAEALAFGYAHPVVDAAVRRNTFRSVGLTEGTCLNIYSITRMTVEDNIFDNIGRADGSSRRLTSFVFNMSVPSISSEIVFRNNKVIGGATTISGKAAAHALSSATNKFSGNDVGSLIPDPAHWSGIMVIPATFAVKGTLTAPDSTPGFFVSRLAGFQHVRLAKARYRIAGGSNARFKIQRNGADIAGFGTTSAPLTATTAASEVSPTAVPLMDGDELDLVIVGVAGNPKDVSVTVLLEYL
jgi:polygalacturonase